MDRRREPQGDAEIVGAIYDAVAAPGRWTDVLARIARALDSDSAVIFYLDHRNSLGQIQTTWGKFNGDAVRRYREEFAAIDPAPAVFARIPVGTNSSTNRIFSPEFMRTDAFFHEFYKPLGLDETLGGTIMRDENRIGILGIHRGGRRHWYSDGQLRHADALMPHLARALQLHRQVAHLTGIAGALAQFVDALPAGLIVLDRGGQAVHLNRRASAVVARGDGLRVDRAGRPTASEPEAAAALARMIGTVLDPVEPGAGGAVQVPRRGGYAPYTVLVAPQAAAFGFTADPAGGGIVGALLLIHDPDVTVLPLPAMLRTLFGLTARESELVGALISGLRLADIAEQTGTSLNTVKFHLKSIYLKTDTNSQAGLIRKVAAASAGLGGESFAKLWQPPSNGRPGRNRR